MSITKTEPVLSTATITAVVAALIAVVVAFWPDVLTEDQQLAILSLVAVVAPIIVGVVGRQYVTPNGSVVERADGTAVLAGEANDLVSTGVHVRTLGEQPRRADDGGVL